MPSISRRLTFHFLRAAAAALVTVAVLGACEAAPAEPPGRLIPGEYIVSFKESVAEQDLERLAGEIAAHHGGRVLNSFTNLGMVLMWLPEPASAAVSRIRAHPDVKYVEQNCYCVVAAH